MSEPPLLGAFLAGKAAFVLSRLIPLSEVERRLDDSGVRGEHWSEVADAWRNVCEAGKLYVSSRGSNPRLVPEATLVSAEEAGDLLGLTGARVRQLARRGALPGRQVAGRWTFEAAAVKAFAARRKDA